jgi:hypothetical protein
MDGWHRQLKLDEANMTVHSMDDNEVDSELDALERRPSSDVDDSIVGCDRRRSIFSLFHRN